MILRFLLIGLLTIATPLAAQSVKLKAHEIEALLTGNTAVGDWEGAPYRQFFNVDGTTIYAQEGSRSSVGRWRIDRGRDEYQSIWPPDTDWEGWYVMEFAGDFYWVSKRTPPTPFKVLAGQQLTAAQVTGTDDCTEIDEWVGRVSSGADVAGSRLVANLSDGASCGTSMTLAGKTSVHCAWPFAYRDQAATRIFERLSDTLAQCLGDQPPAKKDQTVNHPDSYDLRRFAAPDLTIWLSLKDKGALQQSYVFLRAE